MSGADFGEQETTAKFDVADLVQGWQAHEDRKPRLVPIIRFAAKSDMGQVRENNEDKFDFYEPEIPGILACRGNLYVVADGVGGAQAGQIASEMMVKNLISEYYGDVTDDPETALRKAIEAANSRVHTLGQMILERTGMGTTLTAAVFIEDRVLIAQVGDSRAYLLRQGVITQITEDHSLVEEQVRAGIISRDEADRSPFRNVITRSIGASPTVIPDIYQVDSQVGDTWILCSDGLSGYVQPDELTRITGCNAPSEAARQLIELANARGGHDNITVFVLAVRKFEDFASEMQAADQVRQYAPPQPDVNLYPSSSASMPVVAVNNVNANNSNLPLAGAPEPGRTGWRRFFGL